MDKQTAAAGRSIFTIGHSNHSLDKFIELLKQYEIDILVDTRSQPWSKYSPHFNTHSLKFALDAQEIPYVFLGEELGGRPKEEGFYDAQGYVLYSEIARSGRFLSAIATLEQDAEENRLALLCSEENPAVCHRMLLVGRVLAERGTRVLHIRGNGALETDQEANGSREQPSLFDEVEVKEWKSLQSVSPKKTPPNSSGH